MGGEGGTGGQEEPPCPEQWTLSFGDTEDAYEDGGVSFAVLGQPLRLAIESEGPLPTTARAEFLSLGKPPVLLETDASELAATYTPEALGTIHVRVRLHCDESVTEKDLNQFVVLDRERAIFFDPEEGDDYFGDGTIASPYRSPFIYLDRIVPETVRRHLYVRSSESHVHGSLEINTDPDRPHGPELITLIGGYGRDPNWTRGVDESPTKFLNSVERAHPFIVGAFLPGSVLVDGIWFEGFDIRCSPLATANLRLLNSVFFESAIDNDCGITANNVFFGSYATAVTGLHNLHVGTWERLFSGVALFGDKGSVYLVDEGAPPTELRRYGVWGNALYGPDPEAEGRRRLNAYELHAAPRQPNLWTDEPCLESVDAEHLRFRPRAAEECRIWGPFPQPDDPLERYALDFDRAGDRRLGTWRTKGPWEPDDLDGDGVPNHLDGCPLDASQSPPYGHCPTPYPVARLDVSNPKPVIGEEVRVELLSTGGKPITWAVEQTGGFHAEVARESTTAFVIRPLVPGGASFRFDGEDRTGRRLSLTTRLEALPPGRHIYVLPRELSDGDGTPEAPRNEWPDTSDASEDRPISVLVGPGSIPAPVRTPSRGWLPPHVRVYGGYARDPSGAWSRMGFIFGGTKLLPVDGPLTVEAGSANAEASTRVIDGVDLSHVWPSSPTLVIEGGPLVVSRSRLVSQNEVFSAAMNGPAVAVHGDARNVVFAGNQFSIANPLDGLPGMPPQSADDTPAVILGDGAAPSFFFNDFWRPPTITEPGAVAAAFRTEGAAGGRFVGNRLFWEPRAPHEEEGDVAFFDLQGGLAGFRPEMVFGNSIAPGARAHPASDGAGGWLDWDQVAASATEQPGEAAPNRIAAGCTSPRTFEPPYFDPPGGDCLEGAGNGAALLDAIEAAMSEEIPVGLTIDRYGEKRPADGAHIGSLQWQFPPWLAR